MAKAPAFDAPDTLDLASDGPTVDRAQAVRAWLSVLVHNPDGDDTAPYGVAYKVHPANIPMTEKAIFRQATKMNFEDLLADMGEVTFCALWFVGRRLAGEWTLTWPECEKQWPGVVDGSEVEIDGADGSPEGDDDPQR